MTPPPTRWACLRTLPAVAVLLLRLRRLHPRLSIQELVAVVAPQPGSRRCPAGRAQAAALLARHLTRRLPRLFPQPCLYAALVGLHFLRAAGLPVALHCGVREGGGQTLEAHAWLAVAGVACFGPGEAEGFVETLRFDA